MWDLTYKQAVDKAEHLIALGDTSIYLRDDTDFDWSKVSRVEAGSTHRLSGPASAYVIAEHGGLEFRLSVEFEGRDANGRGVSLFDRDRLREVMQRLPIEARRDFAHMLKSQVLPPMATRTAEIREAMNSQMDSEECVRGLIAFGQMEAA